MCVIGKFILNLQVYDFPAMVPRKVLFNETDMKKTKRVLLVLWCLLAIGVFAVAFLFFAISRGLVGYVPDTSELENPQYKYASQIISADGKEMAAKVVVCPSRTDAKLVDDFYEYVRAQKIKELEAEGVAVTEGVDFVGNAICDQNVVKSGRNIPGCEITFANLINVYDIVNANKLVVDQAALAKIEEVFA